MNAKEYLQEKMNNSIIETTPGWIIKYKGKQIRLLSGKTVWNKKHHAKAALINHVKNILHPYRIENTKGISYKSKEDMLLYRHVLEKIGVAIEELLESPDIEYIELT